MGDIEINLQLFSLYIKFSVKAVLSVGTPSLKRGFEQMYSDCRISGEKSFVSRLNNGLECSYKAHFFRTYAIRGAFFSDNFSFLRFSICYNIKSIFDILYFSKSSNWL